MPDKGPGTTHLADLMDMINMKEETYRPESHHCTFFLFLALNRPLNGDGLPDCLLCSGDSGMRILGSFGLPLAHIKS